jgi:hypothetical protein
MREHPQRTRYAHRLRPARAGHLQLARSSLQAGSRPGSNPSRASALCYDAFAILHSGQSKTAVYVAQKRNRAVITDAGEKRTGIDFLPGVNLKE